LTVASEAIFNRADSAIRSHAALRSRLRAVISAGRRPACTTAADLGCCAVRSRQIGDGADLDNRCGSGTAAHARRRQAGLRAVSNDRCLAPGCRRTVTWIEDLADGGVTSW
jgi:hypothetical protein